jgi:hypothetical protein
MRDQFASAKPPTAVHVHRSAATPRWHSSSYKTEISDSRTGHWQRHHIGKGIADLKLHIANEVRIATDYFELTFKERILNNHKSICCLDLADDDVIDAVQNNDCEQTAKSE